MGEVKKILFVINSMQGSGGSERALSNRVNYLTGKYNYDITIVTTNLEGTTGSFYPLHDVVKVVSIPIDFGKYGIFQKIKYAFIQDFKEEKKLLEFIRMNKFNICTSFGSETFLYEDNRVEKFIKIKENRFTYKKMLTDEELPIHKKIWRNIRFNNAVKIQKKMDYIITLTQEDANFWSQYLKKIMVIPNFIETKDIKSSNLEEKIIISVGRLEAEKDFESLIESYFFVSQSYPDWQLHIYGDGSLKSKLQHLIDTKNLADKIILKGTVKNIFDQYSRSSIYVHAAHYEGFPNTMLEAIGHGLPIVAFESVGGVKVLVNDNQNGFLIKNRDRNLLAEKMKKLIFDGELRKQMGANSIEIAQQYSQESIMEKWHQFYQNAK